MQKSRTLGSDDFDGYFEYIDSSSVGVHLDPSQNLLFNIESADQINKKQQPVESPRKIHLFIILNLMKEYNNILHRFRDKEFVLSGIGRHSSVQRQCRRLPRLNLSHAQNIKLLRHSTSLMNLELLLGPGMLFQLY